MFLNKPFNGLEVEQGRQVENRENREKKICEPGSNKSAFWITKINNF